MRIDFVGIGVPKAGTTWLAKCLEDHPDVCFSVPKETYYFCTSSITDKEPVYYKKAFQHCSVNSNCKKGEFTPLYIYEEHSANELRKNHPDAKIIVVLREPISQLISKYKHFHRKLPASSTEFLKTIDEDPRLLKQAKYEEYLELWFKYFDYQQFCFIDYDEIVDDPLQVLNRVYRHLDIDQSFVPQFLNTNLNSGRERMVDSLPLRILLLIKKIYFYILGAQNTLHPFLRRKYYFILSLLVNKGDYFSLDESTKFYLYQKHFFYTADKTRKQTGLKLEGWLPD